MDSWSTKDSSGRKVHAVRNPDQGMAGDASKVNLASSSVAQAESLNFPDILTGTGTDLGSIPSGVLRSVGLPYDKLTFTKSAGVNTGTVVPDTVVNGSSFTITALSGGETIEVTGESNGNALGVVTVVDAGTIKLATALVAGQYFIYQGR